MVAWYPEGRRKAVPTARNPRRGKATTASEQAGQRDLFPETADSPRGAAPGTETGQPVPSVRYAVPKSRNTLEVPLPTMTMEAVANNGNLISASEEWHRTAGRPVRTDGASTKCERTSVTCDELETQLVVQIDGLGPGEYCVYRVMQEHGGDILGGYTVVAHRSTRDWR